jgi:methionyl-tRNA formyltransferase
MRIVFLGTPLFALRILERLMADKYEISLIVTQFPKKEGRGFVLTDSEVLRYAKANSLDYVTPVKFKECVERIDSLRPDLIVCCSYGKILPKSFVGKFFCLNIHPSLLPYSRGATPLQDTILNHNPIGVSLFRMDENMDTGDILLQRQYEDETLYESLERLSDFLCDRAYGLLRQVLDNFDHHSRNLIRQESIPIEPTYCRLIRPEDLYLDVNDSVQTVIRKSIAYTKLHIIVQNVSLNVFDLKKNSIIKDGPLGTLFLTKTEMMLKVSDGWISVGQVQVASKKKMDIRSFLNGQKIITNFDVIKKEKQDA